MAARNKTTLARAQASLTRAIRDFEKTVAGLVRSAPKAKRAKKRKARRS